MVTTNNPIDAISMMNTLSPPDGGAAFIETPEFRDWLSDFLQEEKMTITFKKKDGSLRKMHCTKNLNLIPSDQHPKGVQAHSASSLAVFDLDINEWRSFIVANITHIEYDSE